MEAASVLNSRRVLKKPSPPLLKERMSKGIAIGRHPRRVSGSVGKYPANYGPSHRLKLCLAIFLFVCTWGLAHLARDHLRSSVASNRDIQAWTGRIYSSFKQLQNSTYDNFIRLSSYLQPIDESTVLSNPPSLHDAADPADSSDGHPGDDHHHDHVHTVHNAHPGTLDISKQEAPIQDYMQQNLVPTRDFALNTQFIPRLTSHTRSNLNLRQRLGLMIFSLVAGFDVGRTLGQSPEVALMDGGNNEKSCWLFPGSRGHIGIHLKERISVNKFTIDHLPRDMLPGFAILQAPRKVTLWGRIDGPENLRKVQLYRESVAADDLAPKDFDGELFIPLGSFEYRLSGPSQSNIQTRDVPRALQSLHMDFQVVVLEIVSNWGAHSTCLYRVRVHGDPMKAIALRDRSVST